MANSSIPFAAPQGAPTAIFDPRNPTLVPNFDRLVSSGSGTNDRESPAQFLKTYPRVDATQTATIAGSVTTGDEITLEVSNPIFGGAYYGNLQPAALSHTYTTVGGDTVSTIAEALSLAFNDDVVAQAAGLRVDAAAGVLTFHWNGPIGNLATLSAPLGQPDTITVGGTARTGDQFNVLFSSPAFGPVAPATADALIGGTSFVVGDTVVLTFTNTSVASFPVAKTYTVVAGDNANTVAAGLAALVNADATLAAANVQAQVLNNVLTINQQGAVGNSTVLSRTVTGTGNETVTFEPANGHMAGGTGQPGGVLIQSNTTTGQSATTMGGNLATAINANAVLTAAGISGSNSAGAITMTIPAAAEPLSITAWVNIIALTAAISGAVAAGDVLNLIFTGSYITGSPVTVSVTAVTADTTTTLATKLAAAINANAALTAAGISATSSTTTVTVSYQANAGQLRLTQSVSPGSESITVTAAPTETIVVATTTTETVTIGGTNGAFTGGSGPIIPLSNFNWSRGGQLSPYWYGQPTNVGYDHLVQMVNQGLPIA